LNAKTNAFKIKGKVSALPHSDKLLILQQLQQLSLLNYALTPSEREMLGTLIRDAQHPSKNYDPVHKVYISTLLILCYYRLISERDHDFLDSFRQQLSDMIGSDCSPGRSLRLMQILDAYDP
jgi:hypothetical protein